MACGYLIWKWWILLEQSKQTMNLEDLGIKVGETIKENLLAAEEEVEW